MKYIPLFLLITAASLSAATFTHTEGETLPELNLTDAENTINILSASGGGMQYAFLSEEIRGAGNITKTGPGRLNITSVGNADTWVMCPEHFSGNFKVTEGIVYIQDASAVNTSGRLVATTSGEIRFINNFELSAASILSRGSGGAPTISPASSAPIIELSSAGRLLGTNITISGNGAEVYVDGMVGTKPSELKATQHLQVGVFPYHPTPYQINITNSGCLTAVTMDFRSADIKILGTASLMNATNEISFEQGYQSEDSFIPTIITGNGTIKSPSVLFKQGTRIEPWSELNVQGAASLTNVALHVDLASASASDTLTISGAANITSSTLTITSSFNLVEWARANPGQVLEYSFLSASSISGEGAINWSIEWPEEISSYISNPQITKMSVSGGREALKLSFTVNPPLNPAELGQDELIAYALTQEGSAMAGSTAHLPSVAYLPATKQLSISFTPWSEDVEYTVQYSSDLENWIDLDTPVTIGEPSSVTYPPTGSSVETQGFLRLKISVPPVE